MADANGNELPMTERKEQRIVKVAAGETTVRSNSLCRFIVRRLTDVFPQIEPRVIR